MASNSVIFKVFLRSDGSPEARKFIIDDASVITSYVFVKGKLTMIFPKLNDATFKITWKDTDGDDITIDSDEDLIMAFTEMMGPVKTLYVTILNQQTQGQSLVSNVYCDACKKPITGYRYKCLQCSDFDLCVDCEHAGHHSEHYVLRSSNGELPFDASCRRIAESFNKTVRKAQAMAYKDACRSAKANKKFEKKFDHHKYDKGCKYDHQQGPSSCPMAAPIFDFVNAATQAAYGFVPHTSTDGKEAYKEQSHHEPQQSQSSKNSQTPQPQQHFMEVMMKALSSIFPEQKTSTDQPMKTPTTTPVNEQTQPEVFFSPPEQTPTPMEEDCEQNRGPARTSSWTILDNDISIQNSHQEGPSAPSAPPLDPKILSGFTQLRDMGFGDYPNLVALLKRYEGNVGDVIRHMFDNI